ncbi:MAG TPA: hypothetical protein VKR43_15290 [Bryobacteraceae bacterium]|nr:hypothetical protein [Bryobacteraceae bacterium]
MNRIEKLGSDNDLDGPVEIQGEVCDISSGARQFETWVSAARIVCGILSAPALWYLLAAALLISAVVTLVLSR